MRSYVIVWRSFIKNYRFLGRNKKKMGPGKLFAELLNLCQWRVVVLH